MATALQDVSWNRMSNAVEKVRTRLFKAARALDAAGIAYAVVGGNAVAAWVSRVDEAAVRTTRDVDLLIRRDALPDVIRVFAAEGFVHRRVAALGRAGEMEVFLEGPEGKVRDALHIVFAGEKVRPDSPAPNAEVTESEAAPGFQLISLAALVRMKLTAFRDKDRVHLRDLVEVGLLDARWLDRLPLPLAARLQEILEDLDG